MRLEAVLGCFRRIVWAVECGSGTGMGREGARSGSSGGRNGGVWRTGEVLLWREEIGTSRGNWKIDGG